MRTVARHLAVALLVGIVAANTCGCGFYLLPTYYLLEGEGPAPRSAYADSLVAISPAEANHLKSEALSSHGMGAGPEAIQGKDDLAGSALHRSSTFGWALLAGPVGRWWWLDPGAEDGSAGRALVGHIWGWGVLGPVLLLSGHERAYDQETGQCVASEDITTAAFGLLIRHRATYPAREWLVYHDPDPPSTGPAVAPDVRGGIDNVAYHHAQGLVLGWGLLAFGTKDQRAYLQLVWIPIPLWRTSRD